MKTRAAKTALTFGGLVASFRNACGERVLVPATLRTTERDTSYLISKNGASHEVWPQNTKGQP